MSFRRRRALHRPRILTLGLVSFALWTLFEAAWIRSALAPQHAAPETRHSRERIFIASIHWNNEAILRSHWVDAVLDLVKELGKERVYVSVQESGSWDDSKGALRRLDKELGELDVQRRIILDPTTHLDEINKPPANNGWIKTSRGKVELRRIPYLSRLRNLVMEPLYELKSSGIVYDKVLFLNDVVFTTQDVRDLLATRDGDYAAACSLDFSKPPAFYDTFALRDEEGHDAMMQVWPFFRAKASRRALLSNDNVPVKSCWNGMVAMDASPFYKYNLSFRGVPDSLAAEHVDGSECCLIHADNPLSRSKGVWLNPNVRVGYNDKAYAVVHPSAGQSWVSWRDIVIGLWYNRISRWLTTTWFRDRIVANRFEAWKRADMMRDELGTFCLINEMQVLVFNGWAHV